MRSLNLLIILTGILAMSMSSCQKSHEAVLNETELVSEKGPSAVKKQIAKVRQVTAKYHNVDEAIADGYFNTQACVSNPVGPGAMGVHFVNMNRIDGNFDPLEPEVLVYEPQSDGSYELVAVEYLFVGTTSPLFADEVAFNPFHEPFADFALHVWAWRGNPNGIFEDWNVNVTCP